MIRHIVALDSQRGMAKNGGIPWRAPTDVKRYKRLSFAPGNYVLTGSHTYAQAVDDLVNCHAYVLTTQPGPLPNATVIHNLDAFLDSMAEKDLWVIGGASVFTQTLSRADELYITEIEGEFQCDLFYPPYTDDFYLAERSQPIVENDLHYTFCLYKPKA